MTDGGLGLGTPLRAPGLMQPRPQTRNYSGRLRSNRQEWVAVEGEAEVFEYRQAVFA